MTSKEKMIKTINGEFIEKKCCEAINDFSSQNFCICCTLSTSENSVSSRAISHLFVCENGKPHIYFTTSRFSDKFKHLSYNNTVSFSAVGEMGVTLSGKFAGANKISEIQETDNWKLFKEKHPTTVEQYSHLDGEVFVDCEINKIEIWDYAKEFDGEPMIMKIHNLSDVYVLNPSSDWVLKMQFNESLSIK